MDKIELYISENDYELYKTELNDAAMAKYLALFEEEKSSDVSKYISFELCKAKFAVKNLIKIVDSLGYPRNAGSLNFLFECLQDANWPFFKDAVECLKNNYPKQVLIENIEAKLAEANEEDYMWVSGIYYMANASGIDINLFNLQSQRILEKRDF